MVLSTKASSWAVALGALLLSSVIPTVSAADPTSSSIVFDDDEVKLAINVPEGDSKLDLYFYFEAPLKDHNWAGFGLGEHMDNSLMFITYRSGDNQGNPTLSPRIGNQHRMPIYTDSVNVSMLEGTDIVNDKLILNFHCTGCRDWSEAKLDTSSTSAPFFWALGPEGNIQSDDKEFRINRHDVHSDIFTLDMKAATGTPGVPVIGSAGDKSKEGEDVEDDSDESNMASIVHRLVMGFSFTIVFPGGYLALRLSEKVWLHQVIQIIGFLLVCVGVGSGVMLSKRVSPSYTHPHQIIGFVTFLTLIVALNLGAWGHWSYMRKKVPSVLMKGHRIVGPLAITLGFVNACIGLAWVGNIRPMIGYIVFDLLVVLVIVGLVYMKKRRNVRKGAMNTRAAFNFREAGPSYTHVRGGSMDQARDFAVPPPAYSGAGGMMPMQTFGGPGHQERGPVEHYSVQPNK